MERDPFKNRKLYNAGLYVCLRRQRCLTRAAKHEPQNVNILKELRNLTKLAHEQDSGSGSGGDATDAAPAAGAGRAAANAATEGSASAGDKRKCPKDIEET